MSMVTTALLPLAPLPPHPRLLTRSSSKPTLPAPLGSGRRALRLTRVADDELVDQTVYNGVHGPWSVDDGDVREVLLYRARMVTAAAFVLVATSGTFLPGGNVIGDAVRQGADLFYAAGAGGLGLSMVLIHIYVTPIKRLLQALWAVSVLGSVGTYALATRLLDEGLVRYVLEHPGAMWFIGTTFATLTGLIFKEGCCDRRPEQQDTHEDPAEVDVVQEDHQALVHAARSCSSPRLAQATSSGCKQIFMSALSLVLTLAFVANNTRMLHN